MSALTDLLVNGLLQELTPPARRRVFEAAEVKLQELLKRFPDEWEFREAGEELTKVRKRFRDET